jgi:DnaJ-class molecular chaperone
VLSDKGLRSQYDKFGKEQAMPSSGFGRTRLAPGERALDADTEVEDPSEFFSMIFGGEAFVDWCGMIYLRIHLSMLIIS